MKLYFDKTDEKMKLFGLVYYIIKKRFPRLSDADYDDACSVGFLKIAEILHDRKYDNKKSKIETFICVCVFRAIFWELIGKRRPTLYESDKLDIVEDEPQTRYQIYDRWNEVKKVLYIHLTPKQRKVFELRLRGYKQREIAEIIGTTKANVNAFMRTIERKGRTLANESSCP